MAYAVLEAEITGNYSKLAQAMDWADDRMRRTVRTKWEVPLTLDTKGFGQQVSKVMGYLSKMGGVRIPIDVTMNGVAAGTAGFRQLRESAREMSADVRRELDAIDKELEDARRNDQLTRRQLAETHRSRGTVASVIGGERNINVEAYIAEQKRLAQATRDAAKAQRDLDKARATPVNGPSAASNWNPYIASVKAAEAATKQLSEAEKQATAQAAAYARGASSSWSPYIAAIKQAEAATRRLKDMQTPVNGSRAASEWNPYISAVKQAEAATRALNDQQKQAATVAAAYARGASSAWSPYISAVKTAEAATRALTEQQRQAQAQANAYARGASSAWSPYIAAVKEAEAATRRLNQQTKPINGSRAASDWNPYISAVKAAENATRALSEAEKQAAAQAAAYARGASSAWSPYIAAVKAAEAATRALKDQQVGAASAWSPYIAAVKAAERETRRLKDMQTPMNGSAAASAWSPYISAAKQAQAETKRIADEQKRVRDITREVSNEARGALSWFDKMRLTIVAFGTGYLVIQGIGRLFRGLKDTLLDFPALMETTQMGFEGLLRSADKAESLLNKLKAFSIPTPFETADLAQAAQQEIAFGLVDKNSKNVGKEVVELTRDIGDAAFGLGRGQEGVNRVLLAFGQMSVATRVMSQEMLQLQQIGLNAWQYIAEGLGVTTREARKLVKDGVVPAGQAIKAIRAGIQRDFGGAMERATKTLTGALSMIRDTARVNISGAFEEEFSGLSKYVVELAQTMGTVEFNYTLRDRLREVRDLLQATVTKTRDLANTFIQYGPVVNGIIISWGATITKHPTVALIAFSAALVSALADFDRLSAGGKLLTIVLLGVAGAWAILKIQAAQAAIAQGAAAASLVMTEAAAARVSASALLATKNLTGLALVSGRLSILRATLVAIPGILMSIVTTFTTGFGVASLGGAGLFGSMSAGAAAATASISFLALTTLPLLIAAVGLAAAAWISYRDRQNQAAIANHNLSVSAAAVEATLKRLETAAVFNPDAAPALDKVRERFDKVKDSIAGLDALIRKIGSKDFEKTLKVGAKADPIAFSEVLAQRDKLLRQLNDRKNDVKFKAEIAVDPYGFEQLKGYFRDVFKEASYLSNPIVAALRDVNRLGEGVSTLAMQGDIAISQWVRSWGKIGESIDDATNALRVFLGLQSTADVMQGQADQFSQGLDQLFGEAQRGADNLWGNIERGAAGALVPPAGAADQWSVTLSQIEKMNSTQIETLKGKWLKEFQKSGDFFKKHNLEAARSALLAREAALRQLEASSKFPKITPMPKVDDDGEGKVSKAERARRKKERDRLEDAAKLNEELAKQSKQTYDAMAKDAEDSTRRQLAALKSIKDILLDIFGTVQDQLAKFGIFNSPLDAIVSRIEKLVNLGPRMIEVARGGIGAINSLNAQSESKQKGYLTHALHARMSLDKNAGGDGSEPARAARLENIGKQNGASIDPRAAAGAANGMLLGIAKSFTKGEPYYSCAFVASRMAKAIGLNVKPENRALGLESQVKARGWVPVDLNNLQRGDLIFNNRAGAGKGHVKMYAGSGQVLNSNHREEELYGYRPRRGERAYRDPGASGGSIANALGRASGMGDAAALAADGGEIIKELYAMLNDLAITKLSEPPKEWGPVVKEAAHNAIVFKVQMLLANTATQNMLRAQLGDKGFGAVARALREYANQAQYTVNRLQAMADVEEAIKDTRRQSRAIGQEFNPLAGLQEEARAGGKFAAADPTVKIRLRNETITFTLRQTANATRLAAEAERDRIKVMSQALPLLTTARGSVYEYEQALESANRAMEVWRSPDIRGLLNVADQFDRAGGKAIRFGQTLNKMFAGDLMFSGLGDEHITRGNADKSRAAGLRAQAARDAQTRIRVAKEAAQYSQAVARTRENMESVRDLNERNTALNREAQLVAAGAMNEAQLTRVLEEEAYQRDQLNKLLEIGHSFNRADTLSRERAAQFALNNEIARGNALRRDQNAKMLDIRDQLDSAQFDLGVLRNGADPRAQAEAIAFNDDEQKRFRELMADVKSGITINEAYRMSHDYAFGNQWVRRVQRDAEVQRELNQAVADGARAVDLANAQTALISSLGAETPELERALAITEKTAELMARFDAGDFRTTTTISGVQITYDDITKVDNLLAIYEKIYDAQARTGKARAEAGNLLSAQTTALQLQQSIEESRLGLNNSLTDIAKQRLDWQTQDAINALKGIGVTEKEKQVREEILRLMQQTANLRADDWIKGHNERMTQFDPKAARAQLDQLNAARAALGADPVNLRLDTQEARDQFISLLRELTVMGINDPAKIKIILEAQELEIKAKQTQDAIKAAADALSGSWQTGLDAMVKGTGSVFDRIEQGAGAMVASVGDYFAKLAQQILANYVITKLLGIGGGSSGLGSILGIITGAAGAGPQIGGFAGGTPASGLTGNLTLNPPAGGGLSFNGRADINAATGAGVAGNRIDRAEINLNFPNVRTESDAKGVGSRVSEEMGNQGNGDNSSRRTVSKKVAAVGDYSRRGNAF